MNKAFLFDMDGVLINSEPVWDELERVELPKIFGQDVFTRMGSLVGIGVTDVIERARALGAIFDPAEYLKVADEMAKEVYARAPITKNVGVLAQKLLEMGFRLGLVTQSPQQWLDQVLPRLPFKDELEVVTSLYNHPDLKRKPHPDGYASAFTILGAEAHNSIVLEDSNLGIQSAKAAGAYTIGFRGNLPAEYEQSGADVYADTMNDVIKLVESFDRN